MRRALPIFSVLAVIAVPAVAHAECPPGSWFCADVAVPGPNDGAKPADPKAAAPAPTTAAPAGTANGGTTVVVNNAAPKADEPTEEPPPKPKKKRRPPPPTYNYEPPPPAPPVIASRPHELWGLNFHVEGAMIGKQNGAQHDSGMGGGGLTLRARPLRHLAFDFGVDFIGGRDYLGQSRHETPFTVNALLFVNPKSAVQAYFLAGLGWSSARVDLLQGGTAHYDYFGGQLGFGLEFRITHRISLNTDLIGFVRGRTDDGARQAPEFVDPTSGRTTNSSGGGLLRGGITFYWPLSSTSGRGARPSPAADRQSFAFFSRDLIALIASESAESPRRHGKQSVFRHQLPQPFWFVSGARYASARASPTSFARGRRCFLPSHAALPESPPVPRRSSASFSAGEAFSRTAGFESDASACFVDGFALLLPGAVSTS